MTPTPRQWIIGVLTAIVVAGIIVVGVTTSDPLGNSATSTTDATVTSEASIVTSTSSSTTTTTTSTTTSTTTTVAITAPATIATVPATPRPPAADPNTHSQCSTWSLSSINKVRAGVGLAALHATSGTGACKWALTLAQRGTLSHSGSPCNGTGGQVVGFVGKGGVAVDPNTPATIIKNWLASPSHYEVLTYATFTRIDLQFVTTTRPDGSWRVYGVGNLCP